MAAGRRAVCRLLVLIFASILDVGTSTRALFLSSSSRPPQRGLVVRAPPSHEGHRSWARWAKYRERGGSSTGSGPSVEETPSPQAGGRRALVTLKSGAFNRTIPAGVLNKAMDASLGARLPGELTPGEGEDQATEDIMTPHGHLLSPFHPVFGRWELAFVALRKYPPFYVPIPNMITLTRDGPGRILAHATAFDANEVQVPLGTFTVTENSTRSGRPGGEEAPDGVLYSMQLSSIKPGKKVFDLVLYKEDDVPVLAVRSTDGEESWLLISVEARMRRREANVRKYAREILNLERSTESYQKGGDNMGGYKVMKEVWQGVFQKIDQSLGTRLASNSFLVSMSPFLPILFLGVFMFISAPGRFGEMSFLHH